MRIVLIEREDSASVPGWHRIDPAVDGISICISAGLLCLEDEKQVILSQSRSSFGNYGDVIAIPKHCVKRIRTLKVGGHDANR